MHAENATQLPVANNVVNRIFVRAELLALADRYVIDEATGEDMG
jgi:hypothetical protein